MNLELLTPRELDVLRGISAGCTNKIIAASLRIGAESVKSHVAHILRKLEVDSRAEAAVHFRKGGSVPSPRKNSSNISEEGSQNFHKNLKKPS